MQRATDSSVLGDFGDARFVHGGVSSELHRRGDKFVARTDGPDGKLHDYEITHAFGVSPLQQYLVAFPGGRFQALEIAWDSRPASRGGQRWFHLYPGEKISSGDALHWTSAAENWNHMCADCHSTNVRKSWSGQTETYSTSFAAVSVSCEACHGPGSAHVGWARAPAAHPEHGADHGFLVALDERAGVSWPRDPITGSPTRSSPRSSERELDVCARCHSRRGLIHEDYVHGQPVADDYRVSLLDDELYYPDGQIKGEVYEYGSFIQSRMYAAGVTCSDCHDPHRSDLSDAGNQLCLRCHAGETHDTPAHHFHAPGSPGAQCIGCHMPTTTYMVVDARHDHSLRIPRPDLSVKLGVPNACNRCHSDRPASWAERTVERWYGHAPSGFQHFAEALDAGTRRTPDAQASITALLADRGQPALARASALARLPLSAGTLSVVEAGLADASPLVRRAAVRALESAEPRLRATMLAPLLDDAVRSVRLEAADVMALVPADTLTAATRVALERATAELVAAQVVNGDRPEAHLNLALLYASEQHAERAESELEKALAIDPAFVPAAVNLADLYRSLGHDDAAEPVLRGSLRRTPNDPDLLYALGLVLVREHRGREALDALEAAAKNGPEEPRRGYAYAVALHDTGRKQDALRQLESVLRRHPFDRSCLATLVEYLRESGDVGRTHSYEQRLEALDARDVQAP
jgi:predicted CXXCH cytochrome family protein